MPVPISGFVYKKKARDNNLLSENFDKFLGRINLAEGQVYAKPKEGMSDPFHMAPCSRKQ
jgi:hypothetical protein